MKKKLSIMLAIMLTLVITAVGLCNMNNAYAAENEEYVVGTKNLNDTPKNSAKIGDQLKLPEREWKRYDDSNKNIVYLGDARAGNTQMRENFYKKTYHTVYGADSEVKFKFKGEKLRIIGVMDFHSRSSNVTIQIDSNTYNYNQYISENQKFQMLLFEVDGLNNDIHEVTISQSDDEKTFNIDAIDIDENGELLPYEVQAQSITLDKTAIDLLEGNTDKLTATVLPENASNKKVVWSSSDETIATVDQEGNVTAVKSGQADITAKVEGTNLSASCKVIVTEKEIKTESIVLDKTALGLLEGSTDKLISTVLPENAVNKEVIWASSDESIAKVDENGNVTAIKEGQATIIAKVANTDLIATCEVNVTKLVEENKNSAILSISLVNGATKEYDVSMEEVEKFINWFEERSNGNGSSLYAFTKKISPYKSVKEYIVHDKIASFEVREYE